MIVWFECTFVGASFTPARIRKGQPQRLRLRTKH